MSRSPGGANGSPRGRGGVRGGRSLKGNPGGDRNNADRPAARAVFRYRAGAIGTSATGGRASPDSGWGGGKWRTPVGQGLGVRLGGRRPPRPPTPLPSWE